MINNEIIKNIQSQIDKGERKSPFLFLGKNLDILHADIQQLAWELLQYYGIPSSYLYTLWDSWEKIKISEIKQFTEFSNSKPPYKFQIFFIENISRFTISAGNSLLKFFEEPDASNVIFLSNESESWILDTILSRVQTIQTGWNQKLRKDDFIYSMLDSYKKSQSQEILSYYFRNKLEKDDYIHFLESLIIYSKENWIYIDYLEEIDEDINLIKQNNVNAKYIVDKWLLKI